MNKRELADLSVGTLLLALVVFVYIAMGKVQTTSAATLYAFDFYADHYSFPMLSCNSVTEIPTAECNALVTLYQRTGGGNWIYRSGWLSTPTPCSWNGVTCTSGHVVRLDLGGNRLSGAIPPDLGRLTQLYSLDLSYNNLSGGIPSELTQLTALTRLHLNSNPLNGTVPLQIGTLTNLASLWLSDTGLSGPLPRNLTQLPLASFWYARTNLCESADTGFQDWLDTIPDLQQTAAVCPVSVTMDFGSGAPGSYFVLAGVSFPPNSTGTLSVNGTELGTIAIEATGAFTIVLATPGADPGFYGVKVSTPTSSCTSFRLAFTNPVLPFVAAGPVYHVPAGIALAEPIFLPLVRH